MAEKKIGCAKPQKKLSEKKLSKEKENIKESKKEDVMLTAKVGSQAPDFEAPAYHQGKFIDVKLSDYLGKWVMLCFYPGDFTFV